MASSSGCGSSSNCFPTSALAVAKARREGGLWVPTHDAGSCDEWLFQATRSGLTATTPVPGAAVVYTNGKRLVGGRYGGQLDAVHLGLVLRTAPRVLSINMSIAMQSS